ncbi:hypothetical protein L9F63_021182, partial [Diploptera punctata]
HYSFMSLIHNDYISERPEIGGVTDRSSDPDIIQIADTVKHHEYTCITDGRTRIHVVRMIQSLKPVCFLPHLSLFICTYMSLTSMPYNIYLCFSLFTYLLLFWKKKTCHALLWWPKSISVMIFLFFLPEFMLRILLFCVTFETEIDIIIIWDYTFIYYNLSIS